MVVVFIMIQKITYSKSISHVEIYHVFISFPFRFIIQCCAVIFRRIQGGRIFCYDRIAPQKYIIS